MKKIFYAKSRTGGLFLTFRLMVTGAWANQQHLLCSPIIRSSVMASENMTSGPEAHGLGKAHVALELCCALIVCVFAIFGNLLVVVAIRADSRLKTITNVFIQNLAVTDICVGGLEMPLWIVGLYTGRWQFSTELCKWSAMTLLICTGASLWSMVIIGLNRYIMVVKPTVYKKFFPNRKSAHAYCVVVWLAAVLLAIPYWSGLVTASFDEEVSLCLISSKKDNALYLTFVVALLCALPICFLFYSYYKIWRKVKSSSAAINSHAVHNSSRSGPNRVWKTMFTVVCVDIFCWFPTSVITLHKVMGGTTSWFLNRLVGYLIFCSSGVNPVIYGVMNPQLRGALRKMSARSVVVVIEPQNPGGELVQQRQTAPSENARETERGRAVRE